MLFANDRRWSSVTLGSVLLWELRHMLGAVLLWELRHMLGFVLLWELRHMLGSVLLWELRCLGAAMLWEMGHVGSCPTLGTYSLRTAGALLSTL